MLRLKSPRALITVRKQSKPSNSALRFINTSQTNKPTKRSLTKSKTLAEIELEPNNGGAHEIQTALADAIRPYHKEHIPVVIRGAYADSISCQRWHDVEYLKNIIGEEKECEVEIGTVYTDAVKSCIPFGQYCDYLSLAAVESKQNGDNDGGSSLPMVYLAQNEVFDALRGDYDVPKFCSDGAFNVGEGSLYNEMVWIGPQGCVSPLHYDPLDNIFLQCVGVKRISLYAPQEEDSKNECFYPGYNNGQYNTSGVDVEQPDFETFPLFRNAAPLVRQVVVRAGDLLFIPAKWWHHVRSLEYSVSINVFWR